MEKSDATKTVARKLTSVSSVSLVLITSEHKIGLYTIKRYEAEIPMGNVHGM